MGYKEILSENVNVWGKDLLRPSEIPVVSVYGRTIPEVWEKAVVATWEHGSGIPTEYDQDIDPESRDVTMIMTIRNPQEEPKIHKALPTGYKELEIYRREVVDGVHDHWVGKEGWSYSYHDRLVNWPGKGSWEIFTRKSPADMDLQNIEQLSGMLQIFVIS